jgi:hypothetical protein
MFAEDVDLLPKRTFGNMLQHWIDDPSTFVPELEAFWQTMNEGGVLPYVGKIWQFNGGLFLDSSALPLTKDQIILLGLAAERDWAEVDPAIFGTLLERALNPKERHRLGAHYTPRAYVERLVGPTIEEPLRAEWQLVQAEVRQIIASGKGDNDRKAMIEARKPVYAFYDRLCDIRVLDPACGSGNFLFVALDVFKRLENEILDLLHDLGDTAVFNQHGRPVTPEQFLGIEIKWWAKEITELVLWIGYLQWQIRTRGWTTNVPEPVLRDYRNIDYRDAVLAYDSVEPLLDKDGKPVTTWDGETMKADPITGEQVPDDTARVPEIRYLNPRRAEWPKAQFVVGNPPFVGNKKMRLVLGDGYVEALRAAHDDVPETADYVMYWWNHAAHLLRRQDIRQFGFITTNSITQPATRRLIAQHLDDGQISIVFAIPDHPWADSETGAAVRIAMTACSFGERAGALYRVVRETGGDSDAAVVELQVRNGHINPDFTIGGDVSAATRLRSNEDLSFMGVTLVGDGFRLTLADLASLGLSQDLPSVIRPYFTGKDLVQSHGDRYVIDLFGLAEHDARERYPELYQSLLNRVKPIRLQNKRESYRARWWVFGEPRTAMRHALAGLVRFIATPETSKHRVFLFADRTAMPDHTVFAIASDDAFTLGVLSSHVHALWADAAGSRIGVGNDLRYRNVTCFEPFPFPTATEEQKRRIRELGEQLDAHRKRQQQLHPALTITGMYNVLEKLRANEPLTDKEKVIHEQGLVSILKQIHDELDAAVFDAYGWPRNLSDDEILERLVALNHERAEEEQRGIVRWLRPEFQNPQQRVEPEQIAMAGVEAERVAAVTPAASTEARIVWPIRIAERIAGVRNEFFNGYDTFDTAAVMKRFKGSRRKDVEEVLESLEALGLLVSYGEGEVRQWKPLRSNVSVLSQPRLPGS